MVKASVGYDYSRGAFHIYVWGGNGDQVLCPDGTWKAHDPGSAEEPSFTFPDRTAEPIVQAIVDWSRDRGPDPGTEAKVLREALDVERARLDRTLDRLLP